MEATVLQVAEILLAHQAVVLVVVDVEEVVALVVVDVEDVLVLVMDVLALVRVLQIPAVADVKDLVIIHVKVVVDAKLHAHGIAIHLVKDIVRVDVLLVLLTVKMLARQGVKMVVKGVELVLEVMQMLVTVAQVHAMEVVKQDALVDVEIVVVQIVGVVVQEAVRVVLVDVQEAVKVIVLVVV